MVKNNEETRIKQKQEELEQKKKISQNKDGSMKTIVSKEEDKSKDGNH